MPNYFLIGSLREFGKGSNFVIFSGSHTWPLQLLYNCDFVSHQVLNSEAPLDVVATSSADGSLSVPDGEIRTAQVGSKLISEVGYTSGSLLRYDLQVYRTFTGRCSCSGTGAHTHPY